MHPYTEKFAFYEVLNFWRIMIFCSHGLSLSETGPRYELSGGLLMCLWFILYQGYTDICKFMKPVLIWYDTFTCVCWINFVWGWGWHPVRKPQGIGKLFGICCYVGWIQSDVWHILQNFFTGVRLNSWFIQCQWLYPDKSWVTQRSIAYCTITFSMLVWRTFIAKWDSAMITVHASHSKQPHNRSHNKNIA